MNNWSETLMRLLPFFNEGAIPYTIEGNTALAMQGVDREVTSIELSIQWDAFNEVKTNLPFHYTFKDNNGSRHNLSMMIDHLPLPVKVTAHLNEVIKCDPYRVETALNDETSCWVKHYDYYYLFYGDVATKHAIHQMLLNQQKSYTSINDLAWNQEAYEAWVKRFGPPVEAAAKIIESPELKLPKLLPYLKNLKGKKVLHLLGSHGTKGIAMALLGADVTVVDLSSENARYAMETAEAAGVHLRYIINDVLEVEKELNSERFDYVLLELGVLHYFLDLKDLGRLIHHFLSDTGSFILHEFHPVSTKLVNSKGKKHKADGNYFDPGSHKKEVAFSKHLKKDNQEMDTVIQRYWTMGEVITAFSSSGLDIQSLNEFPNMKITDQGIPKTYLLTAQKRIEI